MEAGRAAARQTNALVRRLSLSKFMKNQFLSISREIEQLGRHNFTCDAPSTAHVSLSHFLRTSCTGLQKPYDELPLHSRRTALMHDSALWTNHSF
jgi:hypothetical protein